MNGKISKKEYYYSEIEKMKEAKDFLKVIDKWNILAKNFSEVKNVPMILPDLLWVAKSGVGKTRLLKLLSEYLYECGSLMEFHGNVRYFEFMLDYCPPELPFNEIDRMINEVHTAAGFRNLYRGIISVDIEEWLGHCEEKHFISFLEYLASNSADWLIVFNVTGERENEIKKLESILSMYFRIEKSILSLPNTAELLEFVSHRLSIYGLTLDESASSLIYSAIDKLRANKYFDGYKTLIMLVQDIIYEVYSDENFSDALITSKKLERFSPDGKYIERATWKSETKHKIGLINWSGEE